MIALSRLPIKIPFWGDSLWKTDHASFEKHSTLTSYQIVHLEKRAPFHGDQTNFLAL